MTSLRKNILTFTVMSGILGHVYAAPVTVYSSFPSSISRLELDVKSRTPYKAYVKNSVNNLNALGSYGRISTDVSNLFGGYANTPGYDTPPKNSFSLSYFGVPYDYIGQCVSFIRAVTNAGHTGLWYGTEKVSKNKSLPQYTPIATLTGEKRNGKPRYLDIRVMMEKAMLLFTGSIMAMVFWLLIKTFTLMASGMFTIYHFQGATKTMQEIIISWNKIEK